MKKIFKLIIVFSIIIMCESISYGNSDFQIKSKDNSIDNENLAIYEAFIEKSIKKTTIVSSIFLVYWIIIVFLFEVDKKTTISEFNEDELFKKYNPLIAGCIQGSRDVLSRDIIATILNLINKNVIDLELKQVKSGNSKNKYKYLIKKKKDNLYKMDKIENYIYNWIFGEKDTIELATRLKELPYENGSLSKINNLQILAKNELYMMGANINKTLRMIVLLNYILLFIVTLMINLSVREIIINIYGINKIQTTLELSKGFEVMCIPAWFYLAWITIPSILSKIRIKLMKKIQNFSGKKIVGTVVTIIVFFGIIICLTLFFTDYRILPYSEILFAIAMIIILTDGAMLKNTKKIADDFTKLNVLNKKLKSYMITDSRDIESVIIWNKYLAYAVAFGLADKILDRMDIIIVNTDMNIADDFWG